MPRSSPSWPAGPPPVDPVVSRLTARALALVETRHVAVIGVVGAPGSGKTTLVEALVAHMRGMGAAVAHVPMDGFHLADSALARLGLLQLKGRIDTFDAWGYVATLRRIVHAGEPIVYCPEFDRTFEQPVAGALPVPRGTRLVLTEGNYLLDQTDPWPLLREIVSEFWFCSVDSDLRRERLVQRHIQFGKSPEQARAWVDEVDEPNAGRVESAMRSADLVVNTDGVGLTSSSCAESKGM